MGSNIDRLSEAETYAVIQIVDKRGFEFVKPDVKAFCKSIEIQGLVFRKEFLCKPNFFKYLPMVSIASNFPDTIFRLPDIWTPRISSHEDAPACMAADA